MLQIAYGDDCSSKTQHFEWHRQFKEGKEDVNVDEVKYWNDFKGIIHKGVVPSGSTVNAAHYFGVLKRLLSRIRRVRPRISRARQLEIIA